MAATQKNRPIKIATPLGKDILLFYRMTGSDRLSDLFEYDLELLSEYPDIKPEQLLGSNVTIAMALEDGEHRYFNGYVTRFGCYGNRDVFSYYRATVRPWLWFLTRSSNCRIFQNKTSPGIIKQVLRDQGFSDIEERLSGVYTPREYCVQYRETDFQFISRLMEEEGIYYFFHHQNGKHTLVLADSVSSHDCYPGYSKIPFHPEQGHTDKSRVEHVHQWGFAKEVQTGAFALTDYDFKKPKADLLVKTSIPGPHNHSGYEFFDFPGHYTETGDGQRFVRYRLEENQVRIEHCDGRGNARGLTTGCLFTLAKHPIKAQNRDYLLVSASYQLHNDGYTAATQSVEKVFECTFTAIASSDTYRPHRFTPKPLVHGAQTAMVVGPKGDEIHTDQYGRVKVQFHWDRYSTGDENSSCWVRVSQPWAGSKWGMLALPRIGQEVIVDFLEGDPDQPIIIGRVYNASSMPPYKLPDRATLTTIKSNSSKDGAGFNELRFEDRKDHEQVFIHAERNMDIRVKNDVFEWAGGEHHSIVKKDSFESVHGDRHSIVKGDVNEAVKGTISITADLDRQEKVGLKHALEAGQEIHLKAGMDIVLEAGASITLKAGGGFIVVGPAGVTISGTPVLINSGGSAGAGSGASPDTPKLPKAAADDKPGVRDEPPPTPRPPKPKTYGPSATVLKVAALNGTPFCQQCPD